MIGTTRSEDQTNDDFAKLKSGGVRTSLSKSTKSPWLQCCELCDVKSDYLRKTYVMIYFGGIELVFYIVYIVNTVSK